jgi:hypothetical protein
VKLLSFKNVERHFRASSEGGYKGLSWNEIRTIFDEVILSDGLHHLYKIPVGMEFYRGRRFLVSDLKENISDLGAPNSSDVGNFGRCQKPGTSVLYVANNKDTMLSELDILCGEYAQLITFRVKKSFHILVVGDIDYCRRAGRSLLPTNSTSFEFRPSDVLLNVCRNVNNEHIQKILVDAFCAKVFSMNEYSQSFYRMTSALADVLFSCPQEDALGFAYPSVANREGINFAFKESYSTYLEATECSALQIMDDLGFGICATNEYASSNEITGKGVIKWSYNGHLSSS